MVNFWRQKFTIRDTTTPGNECLISLFEFLSMRVDGDEGDARRSVPRDWNINQQEQMLVIFLEK